MVITRANVLLAAAATILAGMAPSSAAILSWDPNVTGGAALGGSGTWDLSDTDRWFDIATSADVDWTNGNDAVLGGTAGTVSLGTAITATALSLNSNSYLLDLNGSNLTVSGSTGGSAPAISSTTITNSSAVLATFTTSSFASGSGPKLSGNMNVTLNGTTGWNPAITHDFTGVLWLQGSGTLRADENGFLGSPTGLIRLDGSKVLQFGSPSNTQTHTFTRNIELVGATQGVQTVGVKEITLAGNITGSGDLRHTSGQGTIILAGNNGYTGATALVGQNAIFVAQSNTAFGNSSAITTVSGLQQSIGFRGNVALAAIPLSLLQSPPSSGIPMVHNFGGNNTFAGNITMGSNTVRSFGAESGSILTLTGVLGGGKGLAKLGAGTVVLTGANTYPTANATTGNETAVHDGTLRLDFSLATFEDSPGVQTNIVNHGLNTNSNATQVSQLVLGGGTLEVKGKADFTNSQSFKSGSSTTATNVFTINPGASAVRGIQNGATSLTIDLGKLLPAQRMVGGTVDFTLPTAGAIVLPAVTTSVGTDNTILTANGAAFATVGGTDWAALDAAGARTIVGGSSLAGFYTPNTATQLSGNADISGGVDTTLTSSTTVSSIRFNNAGARTISAGGQTLTTGGILVTSSVGNNLSMITGGFLRGAESAALQDLVIFQNNAASQLTIAASILDGVIGIPIGLTKSGPGTLILEGTNVYTGNTTINAGVVRLGSANALPGGIDANVGMGESPVIFKGGVIGLTGASGNFTRALGTATGQVQFIGSGGFAAYGDDRVVNLGGAGAQVTWNSGSFVPTLSALIFSAPDASGSIDFQNLLRITAPNQPMLREIRVHNGAADTDAELSGAVSGDGGVLKTGLGTLELSATNTYIGATVIEAGTLLVSGSVSAASAVSVQSGGTLGGNGTIGAVTVATGGTIAPGLDVGTFNTGSVVFNGGTFALEISDQASFDQLGASGSVSLNAPVALTLELASSLADGTSFSVLTNDGTDAVLLADLAARFTYNGMPLDEGATFTVTDGFGSQQFQISYAGGTGNDIVLTAIPEPASVALLPSAASAMLGLGRFRRRSL